MLLDDEVRGQRAKASDVEARIEDLVADKASLINIGDQLRVEIQDKMALLDEFEDKFARQYKWVGVLTSREGLRSLDVYEGSSEQ